MIPEEEAEDNMVETLFDLTQHDYNYIIGIDLGTTNSAVAYVDLRDGVEAQRAESAGASEQEALEAGQRSIQFFDVPQFIAQGEIGDRSVLPSFLYLPSEHDLPPGSMALPWDSERDYIVGEFAQEQGSQVPARLVASAKSWLSHSRVDRTAAILPWAINQNETVDVNRVSPVNASMLYLQHIREAWNAEKAEAKEEDREGLVEDSIYFEDQLIVLTVPASFDETARELTIAAAYEAGIPRVILLEEPLAAFYAWLADNEARWQQRMQDGQIILVCDVGGGTTDFSIIGIRESAAGLRFDRLAVGEHLLLGGDNMDLALGRYLETQLVGQPGKLDSQRWHQLVYQCRQAKESLFDTTNKQDTVAISIVGTSGRLIADTLKSSLSKEEIDRLLLDGFFPLISLDEKPRDGRRTGLTELGLPYVQDAAITRHLTAFWQRFRSFLAEETARTEVFPDFLLFNGGTLIPHSIRHRLLSVVTRWFQPIAGDDWTPIELRNPRPELAVATGAAYYGLVRLGMGVRVGSGSPRAYYIGIASREGTASQGLQPAVCVVPRGVEEGFNVRLDEPQFEARTNQPVSFELFSSSTRLGDRLGDIVRLMPDEISEFPPIQTVLRYGRKGLVAQLPVQIAVRLTEIGTLELWCHAQQSEHRWQLQFDVRQIAEPLSSKSSSSTTSSTTKTRAPKITAKENAASDRSDHAPSDVQVIIDEAQIEAAINLIQRTFQTGTEARQALSQRPRPEQLRKLLEETLGLKKEKWPVSLIRRLADTLIATEGRRSFSYEHEARWLNLLGFCLRPGFGDPVDEWRMKQVWKIYFDGLRFPRQAQCRSEWWVFWRRVAGGLKSGQQMEIYYRVQPYLQSAKKGNKKRSKKSNPMFPSRLSAGEELEIWMTMANLEWLTTEFKVELGQQLIDQFQKNNPKAQELWALSRFGSRTAIYGPLDRLIPCQEAARWVESVLALQLEPTASLAHAFVLLARYTGDRTRDIPEEVRERVSDWLSTFDGGTRYQNLLTDSESDLEQEDQDWMFGETLPSGLSLSY